MRVAGAIFAWGALSAPVPELAALLLEKAPWPRAERGALTGQPPGSLAGGCPGPAADGRERLVRAQLAARARSLPEGDRSRLAGAILEEAALARLDPLLILAVIEVESAYDPGALSGRGARGLMQLRRSTLRHEVARSRLAGNGPGDPVLNVQAGVRYYRRLLQIFKSQDLALMAYNAGPNRISRYLKGGGVPERFRDYPRRVGTQHRRLKRTLTREVMPAAAHGCEEQVTLR